MADSQKALDPLTEAELRLSTWHDKAEREFSGRFFQVMHELGSDGYLVRADYVRGETVPELDGPLAGSSGQPGTLAREFQCADDRQRNAMIGFQVQSRSNLADPQSVHRATIDIHLGSGASIPVLMVDRHSKLYADDPLNAGEQKHYLAMFLGDVDGRLAEQVSALDSYKTLMGVPITCAFSDESGHRSERLAAYEAFQPFKIALRDLLDDMQANDLLINPAFMQDSYLNARDEPGGTDSAVIEASL